MECRNRLPSFACFDGVSGPFLGMLKQIFLAHFDLALTEFSPFRHMYAPRCALCTYLRAVWWGHLELGGGV